VAAADESDTAACDEGTSEREVSRRLADRVVALVEDLDPAGMGGDAHRPVPPDGAASTSRSVSAIEDPEVTRPC